MRPVTRAAAQRSPYYAKMGLAPERTLNPFPERIGRYELLLPIGTGGMATVFLGRATGVGRFERDVAVKVIHAHLRTDEESKQLLLEEARLAARIRHANVVPVLEVGDDPFGIYLVLDYVEGDSLAGLMREVKASGQRIPMPLVARILLDSLEGLHASHELKDDAGNLVGLVHRDFSPQNILIGVDGVTKLADFSVAKSADRVVRTRTGLVKGKIGYMSPEQARGHPVDRRCDVWAAGVVAWELIAWRRLHKNSDAVSTLLNIVTESPPLLGDVAPGTPKALEEVVWKALAMDATARTPSALALRKELEQAFRAVGPIADSREVGEYVASIFGQKLRERSTHATEIRRLRAQMHEIAQPAPTDDPSSSSDASPESGQRTRADIPSVIGTRGEAGAPVGDGIGATPLAVGGAGDSVSISSFLPPRSRRNRALWMGGLGLLLAAVALFALTSRGTRAAGDSSARAVKPSPAMVAPAPQSEEEHSSPPIALDSLPMDPPSEDSSKAVDDASKIVRASVTPGPAANRSHPKKAASIATATVAAPKSKAPGKLARDPYGGTP